MKELKSILIGAAVLFLFGTLAQAPLPKQVINTGFSPDKITATVATSLKADKKPVRLALGFIGGLGLLYAFGAIGKSIKIG